jgi:cyanophycinase
MEDVFLVGGGWSDERARDMFGGFVDAVAAHSEEEDPQILLLLMGTDEESRAYHEKYVHALGLVGVRDGLVIERIEKGHPFRIEALEGIDGLMVGGGPTPAYHVSMRAAYTPIRELVANGMPYAGFSAGAVIAATTAIVGGWRIDGVPVCPEDSNEGLDKVTVVNGMALIAGAVDVHAAQWGSVSRLTAAVESRLVRHGVAIDECTTLLSDGSVVGAGRAWRVSRVEDGALVSRA